MEESPKNEQNPVRENLVRALKMLEGETSRFDNAAHALFKTGQLECMQMAATLFKYELLKTVTAYRTSTNLMDLLHTPKNTAQAFMGYKEYWPLLDEESVEIGKDLAYILGGENEDLGIFSADPNKEGAAYFYRIAGHEEEAKSVETKPDTKEPLRMSRKLEETTAYRKAVEYFIHKHANTVVPTKDEIKRVSQEIILRIRDLLKDL